MYDRIFFSTEKLEDNLGTHDSEISFLRCGKGACRLVSGHCYLVKADDLFGRNPYSSSCIRMLSKGSQEEVSSRIKTELSEISRGMCLKLLERVTLEYSTANTAFDGRQFASQ